MDKEEILAKSRAENNDRDFVEVEALDRANSISLNAGVLLCSLISVLHAIFQNSVDYAVWTVMFGMMATGMLAKYAKLKKRHELVLGLGYGALSLFFFVFYLRRVLEVF